MHPDWYLPDINLFVEYAGLNNADYLKSLEWKKELFKNDGKKLLIIKKDKDADLIGALKEELSGHIKFD